MKKGQRRSYGPRKGAVSGETVFVSGLLLKTTPPKTLVYTMGKAGIGHAASAIGRCLTTIRHWRIFEYKWSLLDDDEYREFPIQDCRASRPRRPHQKRWWDTQSSGWRWIARKER